MKTDKDNTKLLSRKQFMQTCATMLTGSVLAVLGLSLANRTSSDVKNDKCVRTDISNYKNRKCSKCNVNCPIKQNVSI